MKALKDSPVDAEDACESLLIDTLCYRGEAKGIIEAIKKMNVEGEERLKSSKVDLALTDESDGGAGEKTTEGGILNSVGAPEWVQSQATEVSETIERTVKETRLFTNLEPGTLSLSLSLSLSLTIIEGIRSYESRAGAARRFPRRENRE